MTRFAPLPLTLRQLQYAVAIAETQSFSRAAERCAVSQPSLSAQIGELESSLGVRLFERGRRGVLVTAAGRELLARASRVLIDVDDLVGAAAHLLDPLVGTLRIGVIPTIGPYLLPDVTAPLKRAYPRLMIYWVEDKTDALVAALGRGELDAALLALEADLGGLEHALVAKDRFVLAMPQNHPLSRRTTRVSSDELRGQRVLLLDDGHCLRDQALSVCSSAAAEELGFRATSLPTLVQMVRSGIGVTLLPELSLPIEVKRGELSIRRFKNPEPARTIVLAWRQRSPLANALGQIAATLSDARAR
jgi:LysR family hydrogen peroxide-inducible transcriptional activator